jgi:hypothetical protein
LGESLRGVLFAQIELLGRGLIGAVPNLLTVAFIMLLARWASKGVKLLFNAIEQGRVSMPGVYPGYGGADATSLSMRSCGCRHWPWRIPTFQEARAPGSRASACSSASSSPLGSTGVVQHLMAGLTLTFARAVRVGEFARLGEVEGTILQIGAVATKADAVWRGDHDPQCDRDVQTTTNYSRGAGAGAASLNTSVTIGS